MGGIYIRNGNVILKDSVLKNSGILISGSKITSIGKAPRAGKGFLTIDAKDLFVSPGFIDIHIHGKPEDIFLNEIKYGTTAIVIAISCTRLERIYEEIDRIKEFIGSSPFGQNVLGVRIEGPYINKVKAGAQNTHYIRKPDRKELLEIIRRCGGALKIMTIAPEIKGAIPLVKLLGRFKITPSIGHSNATYEETIEGIGSGIRHATHTFNAMSGADSPSTGASGAVLVDERVSAEVIPDLIHVRERLLKLLLMMKGRKGTIFVTDSIRNNPPKGAKRIGSAYRLKNGKLAGSCLTMIGALKNAVTACGLSLTDAVKIVSLNPAKLLGVENRKGSIAVGKDADIVMFDKDFDVKMTIVCGRIEHQKQ